MSTPDRPASRFLDRATPPHIVTLVVLTGISALTMNIFLPSLPGMTAYFQTDYRLMQLSVSLYLAVSAVLQIVIGPISDRYGRRSVMLWSHGTLPRRDPRHDLCPDDRDLPRLPDDAGRGRGRHGAEPRGGARHGAGGRGRLDDRLCHHGHGAGADGRADDRRRPRRDLRLAGEFRPALRARRRDALARLERSGRDRSRPARPLRRSGRGNTPSFSARRASGAIALPPPSRRVRSSPISAARPMSEARSSISRRAGSASTWRRRRSDMRSATTSLGAIRCGSASTR